MSWLTTQQYETLVLGSGLLGLLGVLSVVAASQYEEGQEPLRTPASQTAVVASQSSTAPSPKVQAEHLGAQFLGTSQAGCATSNCHGQPAGETPSWKNAAILFERNDPHAKAYEVLFSERSQKMVQRLTAQPAQDLAAYQAVLTERCLGCHATQLPAEIQPGLTTPALAAWAAGVSCESCHGPAEGWNAAHLTQTWQQRRTLLETDDLASGYQDLRKPTELANACVQCHIGSAAPNARVTHDLIAAGHPRLDFDLLAWRSKMPPHWSAETEQRCDPLLIWREGQAAIGSQLSSLEQFLKAGAVASPPTALWPEFSHLQCAQCHQALRYQPLAKEERGFLAETPLLPLDPVWMIRKLPKLEQWDANMGPRVVHQALLVLQQEISTWDYLLAWTYAADAVLRDAQKKQRERASLEPLETALAKLHEHINASVPSRYATSAWRPALEEAEIVQQIRGDVQQVSKALVLLHPATP